MQAELNRGMQAELTKSEAVSQFILTLNEILTMLNWGILTSSQIQKQFYSGTSSLSLTRLGRFELTNYRAISLPLSSG